MYGVKEVAEIGAHVLPPRGKICCVLADASRAKVLEGKAMTEDKTINTKNIDNKPPLFINYSEGYVIYKLFFIYLYLEMNHCQHKL